MHRGTLDIIANILNETEKDALQDHIRRKCGLNNKQFDKYIQMLLEKGLINAFPAVNTRHMPGPKNKRRTIFHIAQTGKQFLKLYLELSALVDWCAADSFWENSPSPLGIKDFAVCPTNKKRLTLFHG